MSDPSKKERTSSQITHLMERARAQLDKLSATQSDDYLTKLNEEREKGVELSDLFGEVENNPCASCTETCCGGGNGYFSPIDMHEDLVSGKIDLMDFYIGAKGRWGDRTCVFLSPEEGCNIPNKYRSNVCLTYTCGKMNVALEDNKVKDTFSLLKENLYQIRNSRTRLVHFPPTKEVEKQE